MAYPWKNLSPKDGFMVKQNALLSNIDQQILTFLYQPLIGSAAYSLYITLWTEIEKEIYWSEGILHAELLSLLNMGMPEVYQARIRLEAIGLLKTFVQSEPEKLYIYELQKPQSSKAFFEEDLFSLLLLERVGERKYKQLKRRFSVQPVNTDQFTEITKSFLDVYHMNTDKLKQHQDLFKDKENLIGDSGNDSVSLESDSFDWNFFYDGLNRHYVNRSSITPEIRETMLVLHNMYGVDELNMQNYILSAADIDTGAIDIRTLKKNVVQDFRRKRSEKIQLTDVVQQDLNQSEVAQVQREKNLQQQGFSSYDSQIIEASRQLSPAEFIDDIKTQKGGFVSDPEEWTLRNIIQRAHLPNAVINILIHYVLVVRGQSMFEKGFANTILNDWGEKGVKTPEDAMKQVRKFYQEKAEAYKERQEQKASRSYPSKAYSKNKTVIRKEKLPDWAKEGYSQPKENPVSKEAEDEFQKRLQRIRNLQKEGE